MAFANAETEAYALELEKAGILRDDLRKQLEVEERWEIRSDDWTDDKAVSVEDIATIIAAQPMRKSHHDAFMLINKAQNIPVTEQQTNWQSNTQDWMDRNFHPAQAALVAVQGPTGVLSSIASRVIADRTEGPALAGVTEGISNYWGRSDKNQTLRDLHRTLENNGFPVGARLVDEMGVGAGTVTTFTELMAAAAEKYDLSPNDIQSIMSDVKNMAIDRQVGENRVEDELKAAEDMDTTNEDNPEYAKQLRAFEILEKNHPTKYQFDRETGAIWDTDSGNMVDRKGRIVADPFNNTAFTEGIGLDMEDPDDQVALQTMTTRFLDESLEVSTAWADLATQIGVPVGDVTEGQYMDVLDVIQNKQAYGADVGRYLPGGDQFLGGFPSDYKIDKTIRTVQGQTKDYTYDYGIDSPFGNTFGLGQPFPMHAKTLRPQYDPYDNWALFAGLSPENIRAVQSQLVEVGALERGEIADGYWGPVEAAAMQTWMTAANGLGVDWQSVDKGLLGRMFQSQQVSTPKRAPRPAYVPETFRPMDPARVEVTVKDSVRALIGRDATAEDLSSLGGFLTEQYASSYAADVTAGKSRYNAQLAGDASGAAFVQPGSVQDVDWEARYIQNMEKRFEPQIESQERQELMGKQQDMGVAMSNLMNQLGGGLG